MGMKRPMGPLAVRKETHPVVSELDENRSEKKLRKRSTEGQTPRYASQKKANMERTRMELG